MSDDKATNDETAGRLRREFTAYYAGMKIIPNQSEWLIADAIDRLAADVEAVKETVVPARTLMGLFAEQRDAAIRERDGVSRKLNEARAEVEWLKAELAARPAANSPGISDSSPAAPQPAAPPPGWLTEEERKVIIWAASELSAIGHNRPPDNEGCLRLSEDLRSVVKRHDAGSPPVVEVPVMRPPDSMTIREAKTALAYRAAMDKAGVKWKEVGRE